MAISSGLKDLLTESLAPLGHVTVRRMFSGGGIYLDGLIFALVIRDTIYLKADATTIPRFEAEGLEAFTYATRSGSNTIKSYWRAPERLLDDPDEMRDWARQAIDAAMRAQVAKAKPKPNSKRKVAKPY